MQTYDLFAPSTLANPHPLYAKMRSEPGLCRVVPFDAHAASRYEDVFVLLKDSRRFSSEAVAAASEPAWLGSHPVDHSLISKDPPLR